MIEFYKEVATALFDVFNENSPLRFPKYFNNDVKDTRVSEQESKIILSNHFLKNHIPFAIEVPTETKHSFTGSKPKSARYDLVIYEEKSYNIKYIIELKAHNPDEEQIRKDIEKFACSDLDCIWFHTLEKANANTYKTLLKKINNAIQNEREKIVGSHKWDFVIAVLKTKELFVYSKIISNEDIINLDNISCFTKILP